MKKVLFVATVDEHIRHFHLPYLSWFQQRGYEVHVAANGDEIFPNCTRKFNVCYQRTPFSWDNIRANQELYQIVTENKYVLIHFHTPVASVFGRWATRAARNYGTKILYTAHGFHFCKGASWKNWFLFYPAELFMAFFTDYLITINKEDYKAAQRFCYAKGGQAFNIPGIGVNVQRFQDNGRVSREEKRREYGIGPNAFLVLAVGELIARKNHQALLRAISLTNTPEIYCMIAGRGNEEYALRHLADDLHISERVRFLGYCPDLVDVYRAADLFAFPSLQEGLPVALMEAMASGLPCIASRIRGNVDLIHHEETGLLFTSGSYKELAREILRLKADKMLSQRLGEAAQICVKQFDISHAMAHMSEIYKKAIGEIDV